jgi:Lysyl oxidase
MAPAMRRGRFLIAAGVAVAVAAGAVGVLALQATGSGTSEVRELLPDLDQAVPGTVSIRSGLASGRTRYFLGFDSAAGNIGDGVLLVVGSRSRQEPEMRLVQQIESTDGTSRTRRVPRTLRYVETEGHAHWHMLDFMRYELRDDRGRLVRPDRKTGFCLGDRYRLALPLERARPRPTYTGECGKGRPGLLQLREGISPGYGDDYPAHLEGQEFDVTSLPSGRYVLVHRVNRHRSLAESSYANNAASVVLILSRPRGRDAPPLVDVVARCPETATCG